MLCKVGISTALQLAIPGADERSCTYWWGHAQNFTTWLLTPLAAQVVNAVDAMGNAVFSDGMSLVFTLTITNLANGKAGLAVVLVRGRPTCSDALPTSIG